MSPVPDIPFCNEDNIKDNIADCIKDRQDCCGSIKSGLSCEHFAGFGCSSSSFIFLGSIQKLEKKGRS